MGDGANGANDSTILLIVLATKIHPPATPAAFAKLAVSVECPYQGTGLGRVRVRVFTDDTRMRHIAEQSGLDVDWDERDDTIAWSGLDGVC